MLAVVTQVGVSRTDWTSALAVVSVVVPLASAAGGVLARPQVEGGRGGRLGLEVDRLVHRAALIALQDVLQARQRRVLARGRERLGRDLLGLQVRR